MASISLPFSLVAGQPENINQLNSNLTAITDQVNGNLETANMASAMKPTNLLGDYTTVATAVHSVNTGDTAGTYYPSGSNFSVKSGTDAGAAEVVPIVPTGADHTVAGVITKYRIKIMTLTNATAPGINFTAGLHQVTAIAGGSAAIRLTLGAAVAGSTATRSAPAANASFADASADFAPPAANAAYVLGLALSGTMPAGAVVAATIVLQVRHV